MSALSHIRDYLKEKFAAHDIDTLMQHFETAIEAKVEDAVADLKQEIAELREELIPTLSSRPSEAQAQINQLPPIAQPDAKVEAQNSDASTDGSVA